MDENGGFRLSVFFIIGVDWVPVTECTYTLFEVMPGNEYWKEINHNNMQFSYRSPTNNPYIEPEYLKCIDIKVG